MKDIEDFEREYMSKQYRYLIEDTILASFSKRDLKSLITSTEESYLKEALPYKHHIVKVIHKQAITDEISKYLIEQLYFYFWWWQEIQQTKDFLNRLKIFYKLNHTNFLKNSGRTQIDINSIPIAEIIGMYVKLPDTLSRNIRCPLHEDNSPSFKIYEKSNSFYCFWCQKWWNAVNFISEKEWISTKEAFKKIVNLYSK